MSKPKPKVMIDVEQAIVDVLTVLGKPPTFVSYTVKRTQTPRPFREIRIESKDLFDACHSPKVKNSICNHLKAIVPDLIGAYPKAYIPTNKVCSVNNTCKDGLMIHVPLD